MTQETLFFAGPGTSALQTVFLLEGNHMTTSAYEDVLLAVLSLDVYLRDSRKVAQRFLPNKLVEENFTPVKSQLSNR
jgi:hypothetical protein